MNVAVDLSLRRPISVDDYYRMGEIGILGPEERVELIEGVIVTMSPIGPVHAHIVDELNRLLVVAVGNRAVVRVQNPVRLSDLSEPEPNLALLRPRAGGYAKNHPTPADTLLAIEVSDSTLDRDTRVKVPLYARHGIPELWLIDVQRERLVAYREPVDGVYARELAHPLSEPLAPALLPDANIDPSGLFGVD